MKILVIALIIMIGFSGIADAQLKKPRISPMEGQSPEQQMKDTEECHDLAVKQTGVNPSALSIRIQMLESQHARDAMPGPRGSLVLSPARDSKAEESLRQKAELEKEYKRYLRAFSEAMEARGYRVK
jgi:hypothetical protein